MLIFTIDNGNGPIDYSNYVVENTIQITDAINVPTLMQLTLANVDNAFQVPVQSAYCAIYSTKFQRYLFTGFITNETEKAFLGLSNRVPSQNFQHMEYTVQATSDDWLLNVKAVPFLPAFVNQTMGQILSTLANTLAPNFFDTSGVQPGDIVPYFQYDPTQKWSDLAKQFGDQARMRYKVLNKQITFVNFGDAPLGISYDDSALGKEKSFDPTAFQSTILTVPIVNDVIVVGDVEPQTLWTDAFVGDGFTTNFPLRHKMWNGATNLLFQDDWTETAFNTNWTIQDPQGIFTLQGGLNAFTAAPPPAPSMAFIQSNGTYFANGSPIGTASVAFASGNTAGDMLFCVVGCETTAGAVSGITDTNNNAWNALPVIQSGTHQMQAFYSFGIAAGPNTVKVAFSPPGGTLVQVIIAEYSGVNTVGPSSQNANTSTALNSSGITTTAQSLLIGYGDAAAGSGFSAGSFWTGRTILSRGALEDQINEPGGFYEATFSLSSGSFWECGIASFSWTNIGGNVQSLGNSYLLLNNGLELGGHLSLQHGYFTFTDVNTGLIGAVFQQQPFDLSVSGNLVCAYQPFVAQTDTLIPSPSGATNLSIRGILPNFQSVSDNFNRPGPSLGVNWGVTGTNAMQIAADTVAPALSGSVACYADWVANDFTGATIQYSQIQLTAISVGDFIGPAVRINPNLVGTYYALAVNSNSFTIYKYVANIGLPIATISLVVHVGDLIRLAVDSTNTLSAMQNGVTVLKVFDGTIASGQPGVWGTAQNAVALSTADNWIAESNVTPTLVKTTVNHQYLLVTRIDARRFTRYAQIYRSVDSFLGNIYEPSVADVTFQVSDYDQTLPWNPPVISQYTFTGVSLPSFGQYVLLDPEESNLALNYTLLSQQPQGVLHVASLFGPTGSSLPILPSQLGPDTFYQLGFGMSLATATIVSNSSADNDQLEFFSGFIPYTNDIPGAGARITFTSWASGKSLARVQDPNSVAEQAVIDGDDGLRTAVFTDLSPLPRTSEECEWAGLAQIGDRTTTQYQGTYTVYDYFWNSAYDYPWSGRYFVANSPTRNILNQNFMVTQVQTTVVEMFGETLQFQVSFGQDLFLEKLLRRFITTPTNILEPNDTAVQPTLQHLNDVGLTFLPDLLASKFTFINGSIVTIDVGEVGITTEVRKADWGWGVTDNNLIGRFATQQFNLTRGARDQTWYMRQIVFDLASDNFSITGGFHFNWTTLAGFQPLQNNNILLSTSISAAGADWFSGSSFNSDQYSQITLSTLTSGSQAGPIVRANATQIGYAATLTGPIGVSGLAVPLTVTNTNGSTVLGTGSISNVFPGDTIRLGTSGTTWSVFHNGQTVLSGGGMLVQAGNPGVLLSPSGAIPNASVSLFNAGNNVATPPSLQLQTSRFTRAMRVLYPLVPTAPILSAVDEHDSSHPFFQFGFSGDINNIRGLEVRDFDNTTVLQQNTVISSADLNFTYNNQFGLTEITLYVYFFNLLWEYSPPLVVNLLIGNPLVAIGQAGPNLISNPSFELISFAYASGFLPGTGNFVADNWCAQSTAQFGIQDATGLSALTGQHYGNIGLLQNVSLASTAVTGITASGALITPFPSNPVKCIPVRGGDYYYFGGHVEWTGASLPAGVNGLVEFQLNFFDSSGNFISTFNSQELFVPSASYEILTGVTTSPSNAAFVTFSCYGQVTNTNATAFNTGLVNYFNLNFDDVFLFLATRGTHASYRLLSNPLYSYTDSPSTSAVGIYSFIMQSGSTDVSLASGVIDFLPQNVLEYIYYDDPDFAGGVVTYNATTNKQIALLGEARYFVGSILTASVTGGITYGNNDGGSGASPGMHNILNMSEAIPNGELFGISSILSPQLAVDGNVDTFAQLSATISVTGTGGSQEKRRPTTYTNPIPPSPTIPIPTVPFINPQYAIDNSLTTYAAGTASNSSVPIQKCPILFNGWQLASGAYTALTLTVFAGMTFFGQAPDSDCNVTIQYSLDGGLTYTKLTTQQGSSNGSSSVPTQPFVVSLPVGQNLGLIQVTAQAIAFSDITPTVATCYIYDIYTLGTIGVPIGSTGASSAQLLFSGPPGITRSYNAATLNALFSVPFNDLADPLTPGTVAFLNYTTDLFNTTNTDWWTIQGGSTQGLTLLQAALPLGLNLSQVQVLAGVTTATYVSGFTSLEGTVDLNINEVWIDAVE